MVLEDVTGRLVEEASQEIVQGRLSLLIRYGLCQAQAKTYVRQTQERLLLTPLLSRLENRYRGRAEGEGRVRELLATLRCCGCCAATCVGWTCRNWPCGAPICKGSRCRIPRLPERGFARASSPRPSMPSPRWPSARADSTGPRAASRGAHRSGESTARPDI